MRIRPDGFVSHTVTDVPANWVFDGAALRPRVRELVDRGVVRVIAGPLHVHITIRLQRPYYRPETMQKLLLGPSIGEASKFSAELPALPPRHPSTNIGE